MKGAMKLAMWIVGGAMLVGILLFISGFFEEKIPPGDSAGTRPAPTGEGVAAVAVDDPVIERFPGSVAAVREAVIAARIVARVQGILVQPGQRVKKGEQLVVLDNRDLESRYAQTERELEGARARLAEAKANNERIQGVAEGAVSQSARDSAKAAYESARAQVDAMGKRLEESKVSLSYATIEAPYDAIVIDRFAEPGDLASPGRPLLGIYDPDRMRLEAWVRESIAIALKPGGKVSVFVGSLDEQVDGTVEEIVPQAEAGSRSFLVKVTLPDRENLYPGMFGRLLIEAGTVRRILVPQRALTKVGQLTFVTLEDGTRRLVKPGRAASGERVEILAGIAEGERVLVP